MKKAVCLAMCCLTLFWNIAPCLAGAGSFSLSARKTGGDEVEVTVSVNGLYVTSAQLTVRFDDSLLDFTGWDSLTGQQDDEADARLRRDAPDTVLINYAAVKTFSGRFLVMRFTRKEAATGTAAFSVGVLSLFASSNANGFQTKPAAASCVGASLSLDGGADVPEPIYYPGDVDLDGSVSSADARLALRATVLLEELNETAFALADVDGDGTITPADARRILRASVFLETL